MREVIFVNITLSQTSGAPSITIGLGFNLQIIKHWNAKHWIIHMLGKNVYHSFTIIEKKGPYFHTTLAGYLIMISPPRDAGRLIITIPTLLLGIRNSQFTSGVDLVFLSAMLLGI